MEIDASAKPKVLLMEDLLHALQHCADPCPLPEATGKRQAKDAVCVNFPNIFRFTQSTC